MAGSEHCFKGIEIGRYGTDEKHSLTKSLNKHINKDVTIFCIGTDRCTGDSFAPFVGTYLEEKGFKNVIGTLDHPVHALNLEEKIKEIPPNTTVLAIDASLGKKESVGKLLLKSGAIQPGKALGKDLPSVGDFQIQGIISIDSGDPNTNYKVLASARISSTIEMAKACAESIERFASSEVKVNGKEGMRRVSQ